MSDNNLAITALAVALAALTVALGQILGQYFATADGYRRCQASVMGPLADKTRLRWRWSQFRFETFFTTPTITMQHYNREGDLPGSGPLPRSTGHPVNTHRAFRMSSLPPRSTSPTNSMAQSPVQNRPSTQPLLPSVFILDGAGSQPDKALTPLLQHLQHSDEMVCWIPFLQSLHQHEIELTKLGCYDKSQATTPLLKPAVTFQERSWDFMSPDIVRPFAVTNVSHIAVMARRLGMIWTDFRPEDGILRAEGNGHVLSSTSVRSIGVILQYINITPYPRKLPKENLFVPSRDADEMGFGILPGFDKLGMPSFRIGTIGEVYASMNIMDKSHQASKKIKDVRGIEPNCTFGFSDLIPLAAPMIRLRGSTIVRLPIPTEYHAGLTLHKEGFVVFHNRLKEYIANSNLVQHTEIEWVLVREFSLIITLPWVRYRTAFLCLNI